MFIKVPVAYCCIEAVNEIRLGENIAVILIRITHTKRSRGGDVFENENTSE